jgi:succinate dehydrogenase/fumarate reductase flavoprotein subunit
MMKVEMMEADVLCVGGGIGGLMAAIRAAELGTKVIVAEKANTLRSGGGAVGNDHFACYIPEVHGQDFKPVVDELRLGQMAGRLRNPEVVRVWFEKAFEAEKPLREA